MEYHIIGDIHGHGDKLESLLNHLGYEKSAGVYRQQGKRVVFLGDFIDRGTRHRQVLDIVRPMIDTGQALAVMGNHEFNAIAFHSMHPSSGSPLRPHSDKNTRQHRTFLDEYPLGDDETREIIDWFKTLPLYHEVKDDEGRVLFRVIHACWSQAVIDRTPPFLDDEFLMQACIEGTPAHQAIERLLKGPEIPLPEGCSFFDKDGNRRRRVRVKWWQGSAAVTYRELGMVPSDQREMLPTTPVDPETIADYRYGPDQPPVFFGHYWFTGRPAPVAGNAACLDYSAGRGGKLVAYHWRRKEGKVLREDRFICA